VIECPKCGPVEHQPIPEDEAHCGCEDKDPNGRGVIWTPLVSVWLRNWVDCPCECHGSQLPTKPRLPRDTVNLPAGYVYCGQCREFLPPGDRFDCVHGVSYG
jgi:hypothetical protein